MRFNSDPKRGAVVIVSVCLRLRLNQVEPGKRAVDCKVERCDKNQIEEKRPAAILLYMKPVLLSSKIPNDIASIHYYALSAFLLLEHHCPIRDEEHYNNFNVKVRHTFAKRVEVMPGSFALGKLNLFTLGNY